MNTEVDNSLPKNILITGIPRSGTSLAIKLLSQNPSILCLSEPHWLREIRNEQTTKDQLKDNLLKKISLIRNEIKKGNPIEMTVKKGTKTLPDNYFIRQEDNVKNLKETILMHVEYLPQLKICIKSNTLFTSCLQSIVPCKDFDVVSIVRDPLYVLLSWRSLNIPISRGSIKIGELYSKEVRQIVKKENLLQKQIMLLDWFFKQYNRFDVTTFKYEKIIKDPVNFIKKISDENLLEPGSLNSSNNLNHYKSKEVESIKKAIHKYGVTMKQYYFIE